MYFAPALQTIGVILSGILCLPPRTSSKFFLPRQSSSMPRKPVPLNSFPLSGWPSQRQFSDTWLSEGGSSFRICLYWWLCVPQGQRAKAALLRRAPGCWGLLALLSISARSTTDYTTSCSFRKPALAGVLKVLLTLKKIT